MKKVSIVIPNMFVDKSGQKVRDMDEALWFAKHCVERIKKYTDVSYELILIDNGSTNEEGVKFLKEEADIYIRFKENVGFGRGCNAGFDRATGEYIICMNNDIFVWPEWATLMIEDYQADPSVGVIMPALMKQTKNAREALEIEKPDMANYGKLGQGAEFGSCWMITRAFFDEMKKKDGYYFDPNFEIGMGEDRDLWRRVRRAGKDTFRTHKTRVFHQGNCTIGKIENRRSYTYPNRIYLKKITELEKDGKRLTMQERVILRQEAQKEYEESKAV